MTSGKDILNPGWDEQVVGRMEQMLRLVQSRVAMSVFARCVEDTPVWQARDSDPPGYSKHTGGVARNSWHVAFDKPSTAGQRSADSRGAGAKRDARAKLENLRQFRVITITNNVPYIGVLEFGGYPNPPREGTGRTIDGYSTQAPAGMARRALRQAGEDVTAIAREAFRDVFRA